MNSRTFVLEKSPKSFKSNNKAVKTFLVGKQRLSYAKEVKDPRAKNTLKIGLIDLTHSVNRSNITKVRKNCFNLTTDYKSLKFNTSLDLNKTYVSSTSRLSTPRINLNKTSNFISTIKAKANKVV